MTDCCTCRTVRGKNNKNEKVSQVVDCKIRPFWKPGNEFRENPSLRSLCLCAFFVFFSSRFQFICKQTTQNVSYNPVSGGCILFKHGPTRSSETRKCACATIKGDIINANKALRKTNTFAVCTPPRGPCSRLPNGPNKNNMKESDTQVLFICPARTPATLSAQRVAARKISSAQNDFCCRYLQVN